MREPADGERAGHGDREGTVSDGTPVVEPVVAVAGTVKVTLGLVVSADAPVVKFQMNGLTNDSPVAALFAPVIVTV